MLANSQSSQNHYLQNSTLHLLHQAGQCAGVMFFDHVSNTGITPRQYAILLCVAENEGLTQKDLVKITGIDRSTMADIIRRMVQKKLIHRERQKLDARAYAVYITEKGYELLQSIAPAAAEVDQKLMATLSREERESFLLALSKLVNNFHRNVSAKHG